MTDRPKIPHTWVKHTYMQPTWCQFCDEVRILSVACACLLGIQQINFSLLLVWPSKDFSVKTVTMMHTGSVLTLFLQTARTSAFPGRVKKSCAMQSVQWLRQLAPKAMTWPSPPKLWNRYGTKYAFSVFHTCFCHQWYAKVFISYLEKTELWVIQREIAWDRGIQGKIATDVQTVPL